MISTELRQWPIVGVTDGAPGTTEDHEINVGSVVSRSMEALQAWGVEDDQKTAGIESPWKSPDAHPAVLTLLLLDRYGTDYLEWDPEVLKSTILREGHQLSNSVLTKILAARVVLQSPSPWRRWEVFHWVSRGLAGLTPNFSFLETPDIGHLMFGADVLHLFDPKRPFGEEVEKYVAATLRHEGCPFAPQPLAFAQRELDDPQLLCTNCAAQHRDDNDTRCISCGSDQLTKLPREHQDLYEKCVALWEQTKGHVLEKALASLPETPEGNLVYSLQLHWAYARQQRQNLLRQLRSVANR